MQARSREERYSSPSSWARIAKTTPFRFEQAGSLVQKNHATAGMIPEGAIIQRAVTPTSLAADGAIDLLLVDPDYTTAQRVCDAINRAVPRALASAVDEGRVRLRPGSTDSAGLVQLMADVENLSVEPSIKARVIVNERTGTIVSGGDVWISAVSVAQGDIRVAITQRYLVSQPQGVFLAGNSGVHTAVVPEADINVNESDVRTVQLPGASIDELVRALRAIRASSRDVIAILQGIKRAGALHAELIIQ
jgi:flagellar P-ring protein precursor FlgI